MKKATFILSLTLIAIIALAFNFVDVGEEYETISIGTAAPLTEYQMIGTDNKNYSLESLASDNGLLVIFSCNTCPFIIAWEDRYPEIAQLAAENKIGFALVNSNQAKRSGDDSMEEMIKHADDKGYSDIPYLVDENSQLANAFGAKTTPHVFLFDKELSLVYEGAIDDNHKSKAEVKEAYLTKAIQNLTAGNAIDPQNTKALGCSIKRVKM
jgi:thioredoxin-related protein